MITVRAPAKVNLSLRVHPPDGSGYHPLESVVQTVSLHDHLRLRAVGDRDLLEVVPGGTAPEGAGNLVLVALAAARRAGLAVPPLDLHLEKEIPTEAGLGGGSADAAAMLVGARHLDARGLEVDLLGVAAEVGSDVPAVLLGGTVGMRGRGELVVRLPASPPGTRWLVVVPPFGLSTAAVYRAWDELGHPSGRVLDWPATEAIVGYPPRNDLEPAAFQLEPRLAAWVAAIERVVGRRPMLSGSGTALFVELDRDGAIDGGEWQARARLWRVVAPAAEGPLVLSG